MPCNKTIGEKQITLTLTDDSAIDCEETTIFSLPCGPGVKVKNKGNSNRKRAKTRKDRKRAKQERKAKRKAGRQNKGHGRRDGEGTKKGSIKQKDRKVKKGENLMVKVTHT